MFSVKHYRHPILISISHFKPSFVSREAYAERQSRPVGTAECKETAHTERAVIRRQGEALYRRHRETYESGDSYRLLECLVCRVCLSEELALPAKLSVVRPAEASN